MTKILLQDYSDDIFPDVEIKNMHSLSGVKVALGVPLTNIFPGEVSLVQLDKVGIPDYFSAGSMPLVSERLKRALEDLHVQSEFFELEVHNSNSADKVYFFNLLQKCDCLNWNQSDFEERKGFALRIRQLVLESVKDEPPVYRIAKTMPSIFAVSDFASELLVEHDFSGFHLVEPRDWKYQGLLSD